MKLWRYWMFFSIAAVALVISWGMAGKKFKSSSHAFVFNTESPCKPLNAPCAAYTNNMAFVFHAIQQKESLAGRVRFVSNLGEMSPSLTFKLQMLDREESIPAIKVNDTEWHMDIRGSDEARSLKLEMSYMGNAYLAEFPLR